MAFGLKEAIPFDFGRVSRLLRVRTDESKAAGCGSEAKPPKIKGVSLPKSEGHARTKMPVGGILDYLERGFGASSCFSKRVYRIPAIALKSWP